ncbi:MAG TPA: hypothetical protein VN806_11175 [Caulobacteraceae bacterium]|nr:hypothetical protein [Caulobacteraceae bacterium]
MHVDAGGGDTLAAVIIGAVLATLGGFAATQIEGHLRRRERERSAALLFGEVLSVIELLTNLADQARGRGDPYGGFTMRMTRGLKREIEVYDRNRESLYDLRDSAVRAKIHSLAARLTLTLEGVFDLTDEIALAEATLAAMEPDHAGRPAAEEKLATLREQRALSFDFVVETAKDIKPVIAALEPLARQSFETYASTIRPS